jgi:hypothetical protein
MPTALVRLQGPTSNLQSPQKHLDTLLHSVNGSRSVVVFAYAGFMLLFVIAATGRHMLVETIIAGRMLQAPERGQSHKVSNAVIRAHHAARILTLVA